MNERIKEYSNDDITVVWQSSKCSHSAVCVKSLKAVFNPKTRPWINLEGSDNETIAKTVRQCPSGAISLAGDAPANDVVDEASAVAVQIFKGGPLRVKGKVEMTLADGSKVSVSNPTLCRCGASVNKPYCDGSHNAIDWTD